MSNSVTENALLQSDHRRRRWIIRIVLTSIFILLILTVAFLLLSSPTGMTTNEAVAAFAQIKLEQTLEDVERLLGKPVYANKYTHSDGGVGAMLTWQFFTPDKGNIDCFQYTFRCDENGMVHVVNSYRGVIGGWRNLLITRWLMLIRKLGL